MKLDRNINPDGRGKYALINLRTNQVQWGGDDEAQFFVLKYKDKFTAPALKAYADAVMKEVRKLRRTKGYDIKNGYEMRAASLEEFANEIYAEAKRASKVGFYIPS